MKVDVFNQDRKKVREIDLADEVFAAPVNEALFYEVVKAQLASRRAGTHATKERSAVSGSTKKIYRQKGTGQARHGSKRAPVFVGGGKAHGPVPRSYAYEPPKKMRRGAMRSALSLYQREGRLLVLDSWELEAIKTKALAEVLDKLKVPGGLLVDAHANDKLRLSSRNLEKYMFLPPEGVNVYDVLRHPFLVASETAVRALEARCKDGGNGAAAPTPGGPTPDGGPRRPARRAAAPRAAAAKSAKATKAKKAA